MKSTKTNHNKFNSHVSLSSYSSNQAVLDSWIINKLIHNNPNEFLEVKEILKQKVMTMPDVIKRSVRWEIEDAIERNLSLTPIGALILTKNYIH